MNETGCLLVLGLTLSTKGPIFLATRDLDVDQLDFLLQQDEYAEMVNEKDGGEAATTFREYLPFWSHCLTSHLAMPR